MDLYKLNTKIFSKSINYKNKNDTIVYCFAHNLLSVKEMAQELKEYNIDTVHIIKNIKEVSGVISYEIIVNKYKEYGINTILVPFFESIIHTKNESNTIIEYANYNKIQNIIICAPIFHILRASITLISSAIQKGININFMPIIIKKYNWKNIYMTHQGNTNDTCENILEMELDRIYEYTKKGDIKPFKTIIKYLDKNNNL